MLTLMRILRLGLMAAVPLVLGGCALGSVVAYKLVGPPSVPAQHVPAKEPLAVLVENYRTPSMSAMTAEQLTRKIADELKDHDVAPVVEIARVQKLRDSKGAEGFKAMTVSEVGRAVGAKQVLYVDVLRSGTEDTNNGEFCRGVVDVRVRLVNAEDGKSLWPNSAEGYSVIAETSMVKIENGVAPIHVRERAVDAAGTSIARLFYSYKPEEKSIQ